MSTAAHKGAKSRRLPAVLVVVALVAAGAVAWALRPGDSGEPFAMSSPRFELLSVPRTGVCSTPPAKPFAPTSVSISGVVDGAKVLALPRDHNNVPGVPPTSAKYAFAWDRPPGIKPGAPR